MGEERGTALVTGASRGIGRAVAIELDARGYDVVATMRDVSAGEGLPTGIRVERLDVTDRTTIDLPASLRIVVNNAGVETDNLPIEHGDVDLHWKHLFEANVFGLVRVTQAAIPVLRSNGGGVICNVTSSSILAPVPFLGMYRASKAAVMAMGESLAAEVAPFGIRVIEVMPGPIVTDMLLGGDHPAEAIAHPEYADLARRMYENRAHVRDQYTPADEAARRIVNAIEDDGHAPGRAPLRYGCDDLSEGMLTGWRATSHDAWIAAILPAFS